MSRLRIKFVTDQKSVEQKGLKSQQINIIRTERCYDSHIVLIRGKLGNVQRSVYPFLF